MFRSYQTIFRELLCLVVKLLGAAYFCTTMKGAHNLIQMHAAT